MKQKPLSYYWRTSLVVGGLSLIIGVLGVWLPLENLGYNLLFKMRQFQPGKWDPRITVIGIDQKTLSAYGQPSSWNREQYVKLLQVLEPYQPSAIGFNIIFSERTPAYQALVEEMALNGSVVLGVGLDQKQQQIEIIPELKQVTSLGHIFNRPDSDGITRNISLYIGNVPSFGLAMVQTSRETISQTVQSATNPNPHPWARENRFCDTEEGFFGSRCLIPRDNTLWVNWVAPVEQFPTYSFVDVVEQKIDPRVFANKIVLVGATATGLDPLRTPFNQKAPTSGVYLHAVVIDNLLQGRPLNRFPPALSLVLLLLIPLLTTRLLQPLNWQGRLITLVLLLLAWGVTSWLSFAIFLWWLPTVAPLGTILLTAMALQLREQYEKQQLMSLFSQHLAPEMAEVIWQRRAEIFKDGQLEPQEVTATIVFMDLRSFTTISEGLTPRELLQWLNLYLNIMSHCLMEYGGVIDKYIGDAIMAVFGVPFARTSTAEIRQDALNAVAASLAIHEQIQQLNQRLKAEGKPLCHIGIGIHTGTVVIGSLGGSGRLNYSVVGDTVNTAARLEAMNKQVTTDLSYHILVSESTWEYVKDRYLGKEVGTFQLRGKHLETKVYTILDNLSSTD